MNSLAKVQKGSFARRSNFNGPAHLIFIIWLFGDTNPVTGEIDDLVVSNNADSEKVLATVVAAVYAFFDKHPEAYVYATGSSNARTRLYRIGITRFYEQMIKDFYFYGQVGDEFYEFEIGNEYKGFLAQQRFK